MNYVSKRIQKEHSLHIHIIVPFPIQTIHTHDCGFVLNGSSQGIHVGHSCIVTIDTLRINGFRISAKALMNPHVGDIRGTHAIAPPLMAGLVDDDIVEGQFLA